MNHRGYRWTLAYAYIVALLVLCMALLAVQ